MSYLSYQEFLKSKLKLYNRVGKPCTPLDIHPLLFPFQRTLAAWAVRKGRSAIFADTGLGKTFMQLEFARIVGEKTLIVSPLSVARQSISEAKKIGLDLRYVRSQSHVSGNLSITNYEMIEHFDASQFGCVVLDESSILKSLDGKTRTKLIEMFAATPYKICCTATPAPNDITEIANHAEFLSIATRQNMLAEYFVHDDEGWRLKGHAEDAFYRWMASWSMSVRFPSDIGYDDTGYILPPLNIQPMVVGTDYVPEGQLINLGLNGIHGRLKARRATIEERVNAISEVVNKSNEQWILWCGLNDEGRMLKARIRDSVLVEGADSLESKQTAIESFQDKRVRVMITKTKIAGFGMNFQNCHNMAFVGISDSWEAYYQAIRRCYRFGQTQPVDVRIVVSEAEVEVYDNVMRKEREAKMMGERLLEHVKEFEKAELVGAEPSNNYHEDTYTGSNYTLMLGDSATRMKEMGDNSIDLSVFSPPFLSLYVYSPTERDMGNSKDHKEFFTHFGYIADELLRVTKPGRNVCVHISQLPSTLVTHGVIGLLDLRGSVISHFQQRGFVYHGEVCIDKDPQAQAIRTHSKGLLFVQLRKDASWLRPGLADYILIFRKPGENAVPVHPDINNNDWIEWARPIWYGIRETETLNSAEATENKDERHICPLQLGTIERCIRLWSNPGETVFSPFAGIGSEGHVALKFGRKFTGIELKESYYRTAIRNLEKAVGMDKLV